MLSERSHTQKAATVLFHLWACRNRTETEKWFPGAGNEGRSWLHGEQESFGGNGVSLHLDRGGYMTVCIYQNCMIEPYTKKGEVYIGQLYLNSKLKNYLGSS